MLSVAPSRLALRLSTPAHSLRTSKPASRLATFTRRPTNMAIVVKLTQKLERGFLPWKQMYQKNEKLLQSVGGKLIFAGPHAADDNTMEVIIQFDSPEAMKAFKEHPEITKERVAAGVILDQSVPTPLGPESFWPGSS